VVDRDVGPHVVTGALQRSIVTLPLLSQDVNTRARA
jgi:hypothetical protein